jgi:hypothetical protein
MALEVGYLIPNSLVLESGHQLKFHLESNIARAVYRIV